jgi:hypothetical protein
MISACMTRASAAAWPGVCLRSEPFLPQEVLAGLKSA